MDQRIADEMLEGSEKYYGYFIVFMDNPAQSMDVTSEIEAVQFCCPPVTALCRFQSWCGRVMLSTECRSGISSVAAVRRHRSTCLKRNCEIRNFLKSLVILKIF